MTPWSCDQNNPCLLFYKFGDASDRYLDLIHRCCVTAADVPLTTCTESSPRNNGDFFLLQELEGKLPATQSSPADIGEHVEGSLGVEARNTGLVEGGDDEVAAQAVLLAHPLHAAGTTLEGLDGRLQSHDGGAEHGVLVNFHHRLDDVRWTATVADPPAGHGKGLGKSMQENGPLLHARQDGYGVMGDPVVGKLAVDLVGDDDEVVFSGKGGDPFEFFQRHDGTGRVGREVKHQDAGPVGDGALQIGCAEHKAFRRSGCHGHRFSSSKRDARSIRDVAGLVVENLVARIQQGSESEIDRFGDAHSHDDLVVRIVGNGEVSLHILGDRASEAGRTQVRGVTGPAFLQRINSRFADVPGRDEIWFADAEGNDILHRLDNLKKVADSGTGDPADVRRNA